MKDILLIGGPTTLTGVDRIDDDLLSILAEKNLSTRKAVIVWPTSKFLTLPVYPDSLKPHVDMDTVVWSVIEEKGLLPAAGITPNKIDEIVGAANKDKKALGEAMCDAALHEVVYRLSRLLLNITGGLRLAVVVGNDAPVHSLSWTRLVQAWSTSGELDVKRYNTKSSAYGPLNSVKDWGFEFDCLSQGTHRVEDLLPLGAVSIGGQTFSVDVDWYTDTPHALSKEVDVTYPVETRAGNAKAVQVNVGDGFMLVVPEPDKPKNFRIGLMAVAGKVDGVEVVEAKASLPKPKKAVTSNDQYVTVKEAAEILKCSEKTIRNYYGDGRLEYKKVGQRKVLILRSSLDALLKTK